MKKIIKLIIISSAASFIALLFPLYVMAGTSDILPELYASLPDSAREALPKGTPEEIPSKLTPSFAVSSFSSMLGIALRSSAKELSVFFGMITASAIVRSTVTASDEGIKQGITFLTGSCSVISLFSFLLPLRKLVLSALNGIGLIIKLSLPAITSVTAASGSITSSTAGGAWLTALLTLIEQAADKLVSPLISVCLGFLLVHAVSKYSGAGDFSGCISGIKNTTTVLLSLLGIVFSLVMSWQAVIAKSSDGALLKSIKFASGSFIPIVGGSLSEAASSYIAGLSVIKSSVGAITVVSLLATLLPIILRLALSRIGLDLISAYACAIGCSDEAGLAKEARSILDLCLALVSLCCIIFIIAVSVFVKTAIPT